MCRRSWAGGARNSLPRWRAGYEGMRVGFNSVWQNTDGWEDFCGYERVLDKSMAGEPMMALCTYPIEKAARRMP